MSSPEPREFPSPVQLDKDFVFSVDRDFTARVVKADEVDLEVAAPKAQASSVTAPVPSQSSDSTDLIPPPEDLTALVEPGPSQLQSEEELLQGSSSETSLGVSAPLVSTSKTLTSSSPNVVK